MEERIKENFKFEIEDKFTEFKDEIFTGLDKVMGELEAIRQENVVHKGQHDRIEDTLERLKRHTNLPLAD